MANYQRGDSRRGSAASTQPGLNTTRRSWSNGGMHFTMETTTFVRPGSSFRSFNVDTEDSIRSFAVPRRTTQPRAGGMLGAAFNLLGDVLASQQPQQQGPPRRNSRRDSKQAYVDDNSASSDEEDTVRQGSSNRPRGFVSKVAEKFINNSQSSKKAQRDQDASHDRAPRRSKPTARSRSYRTEERHPPRTHTRAAMVEDTSDDSFDSSTESEDEDFQDSRRSKDRNSGTAFAHDHPRRGSVPQRGTAQRSRPSHPARSFTTTEHIHMPSSRPVFEAFFGTGGPRRSTRSIFDDEDDFGFHTSFGGGQFGAFGNFERMFDDDFFFALPRSYFAGSSGTTNGGAQSRPTQSSPSFSTPGPSKPPRNLLKSEEAKTLFQTYNARWNSLAPTDPNIPYPCRGMKATALSTRDTLWAPLVSAPISTWSEETVMQANAQAFFLGVAGLTPRYTEAPGTGRIVMAYDKARASPEQVRQLVDILKKEKTRWHSDRLGRRNGGTTAGPNEALQRDEKARAVFHAVCELMDVLSS